MNKKDIHVDRKQISLALGKNAPTLVSVFCQNVNNVVSELYHIGSEG